MPTTRDLTGDVEAFLAAVEPASKREDARTLAVLMQRVTGESPVLWGTIVGFGRYHYRYESGHEGDAPLVGFSPRQAEFSIYLTGTYLPEQGASREALLARLGKHKFGKACLYVKRLSDIDPAALEGLITLSVDALRQHYPDSSAKQ